MMTGFQRWPQNSARDVERRGCLCLRECGSSLLVKVFMKRTPFE